MIDVLRQLRKKVVVGFVGGSDLVKISEQLEQFGFSGAISHLSIPVLPDDI
jgi:phosphomannomutase